MGYLRQRKVHRLVFEDDTGDLAGLEVRMYSMTIGQLMDLAALADAADGDQNAGNQLFTDFAAALVSWNLEDEVPDDTGVGRRPVPATLDGVRSCDLDFIGRIVTVWMSKIAAVPAPLGAASPSGPPPVEASIPMVPLSPSPPN